MTINFNDKVAIVTGAGGGLGRCHALQLAERGANIVVNDLGGSVDGTGGSSEAAEKVVDEIKSAGGNAIANGSSVTDKAGVKKLVDDTMTAFGRIDILVNNASNDQRHSLESITEKFWDNRMAINLKHYLFAIQTVKKSMVKNKGGSIINLGSVSWVRGVVMFPAYSTAKAGIHGLTRSLARDLGKHNIRINSIAPGSISTARQSKLWLNSKFKKEILRNQALKKQLLPDDVSKMVLFLASDVSSGCTKQNFTVDAGLT